MESPVIVDEHGSILAFESFKDAALYLEPIDVQNDEYISYDGEGRLLRLIATSPRITIEYSESEPHHADELRKLLIGFLERTGKAREELIPVPLRDLVARALEYKTK